MNPHAQAAREVFRQVGRHREATALLPVIRRAALEVIPVRENGRVVVDRETQVIIQIVRERGARAVIGIGAFESREFVRNLGGDIQVTSTPNVGSLFRIVLPDNNEHSEPEVG